MEAIQKLTMLLMALAIHFVSSEDASPGWEKFANSYYSFSDEIVSWIDAVQYCQMYDAHLVHINDGKEDDYIIKSMKGRGITVAWTGATERLHRGSWVWMPSGEPMGRFVNWYGTEPLGQDDDCMVVDSGYSYRWADTACTFSYRFICEKEITQKPQNGSGY
ncbi:hypothetical protein BsWGS_23758 [Bradybaena similaris]